MWKLFKEHLSLVILAIVGAVLIVFSTYMSISTNIAISKKRSDPCCAFVCGSIIYKENPKTKVYNIEILDKCLSVCEENECILFEKSRIFVPAGQDD